MVSAYLNHTSLMQSTSVGYAKKIVPFLSPPFALEINDQEEPPVSSLLASVIGKIIGWSVKIENPKLNKKFIGLVINLWSKLKGGYVATAFMKLSDFSHFPFQIEG